MVYGAIEVLGPVYKVESMPVSQRIAPIINLNLMVQLMDWTMGIDHYLRSGDASHIQGLTRLNTGEWFRYFGRQTSENAEYLRRAVET